MPSGGLASVAGQALLAFLPGDIAVPVGTFVEPVSSGAAPGSDAPTTAVNPLLVTTWLKSAGVGADTPLLVQTDQTTVLNGLTGGFDTMSELYFDLVTFAQPVAPIGTADANRILQLLTWAREALPSSPNLTPLATQPADWPIPNTSYWNKFSFTYAPPASSPATGGQTSTPPRGPMEVSPVVWGLRVMPRVEPEAPAGGAARPVSPSTQRVSLCASGRLR